MSCDREWDPLCKIKPDILISRPTLPIHCDTFGGSKEDLWVFTGETSNVKAKLSENFLSPDQNWPNFGGFGGLGSGGTKSFDFYSKRHILLRIHVV